MISPSPSRPETGASPSLPGDCRILFGHQSVGMDLLRGIHSLSVSATISDIDTGSPSNKGYGIFHFRIGENGDPYSKIDEFAAHIQSRETRWDVAAMKLCYVDIDRHTDVDEVFEHYRQMAGNPSPRCPRASRDSRYRAVTNYPTRAAVPFSPDGRTQC